MVLRIEIAPAYAFLILEYLKGKSTWNQKEKL